MRHGVVVGVAASGLALPLLLADDVAYAEAGHRETCGDPQKSVAQLVALVGCQAYDDGAGVSRSGIWQRHGHA